MISTPPPTSNPIATAVFVARQPIFDSSNRRVAYELLYRESAHATDAAGLNYEAMCSDTALHSIVSIGLDRLTGGSTAFVNVTGAHLIGELYRVFDPKTVVLELLESIDGSPEIVSACERAVAAGYTLALDDYDGRPSLDVLLPFCKIVKLDVLNQSSDSLASTVRRLHGMGLKVLAERVESGDVHSAFQQLGCTLFQGYVFSRPETLDGQAIAAHQATILNILMLLEDPRISDNRLGDAFSSHPSLSYTLLRIVNSAWYGLRKVTSIPQAIRLVGRSSLSRWLHVMLVASVASRNPVANEAVLRAMVRGRFCELVTVHGHPGDPSVRFLIGLLSCIDVLMGQPMEQVLDRLPIGEEVREALLEDTGPHAAILRLSRAYEVGAWDEIDAEFTSTERGRPPLATLYGDAVQWAGERLRSATVK